MFLALIHPPQRSAALGKQIVSVWPEVILLCMCVCVRAQVRNLPLTHLLKTIQPPPPPPPPRRLPLHATCPDADVFDTGWPLPVSPPGPLTQYSQSHGWQKPWQRHCARASATAPSTGVTRLWSPGSGFSERLRHLSGHHASQLCSALFCATAWVDAFPRTRPYL